MSRPTGAFPGLALPLPTHCCGCEYVDSCICFPWSVYGGYRYLVICLFITHNENNGQTNIMHTFKRSLNTLFSFVVMLTIHDNDMCGEFIIIKHVRPWQSRRGSTEHALHDYYCVYKIKCRSRSVACISCVIHSQITNIVNCIYAYCMQ